MSWRCEAAAFSSARAESRLWSRSQSGSACAEARQAHTNSTRCARRWTPRGMRNSCDAARYALARRGAGARTVVVDGRRQFWLCSRGLRVAQPRQRGAQQAERLALRGRRALSSRLARGQAVCAQTSTRRDAPSLSATRRPPRRRRPAWRRCGASGPSGCHTAETETQETPRLKRSAC